MQIDVDKYLAENDNLIQSIAWQFASVASPRFSRNDLLQEARRAAVYAIGKFDPNNGAKLSTYLWRAMFRACRDYVSKNNYDLNYTIGQQRKDWVANKATPEDLAATKKHHSPTAIRMDAPLEANVTLRDIIPASGDPCILDTLQKSEQVNILKEEISKLTPREALVVEGVMSEQRFADIGATLGVTRQRAQQIHKKALKKLSSAVKERLGEEILI